MAFQLDGACPYKDFLNDLVYVLEGETLDGAPYYKALGAEEYLYHDSECDGSILDNIDLPSRWVLDAQRPSPEARHDLDGDWQCDYHARLLSSDNISRLPLTSSWTMFCGSVDGWITLPLDLREIGEVELENITNDTATSLTTRRLRWTDQFLICLFGLALSNWN